MDNNGDLMVEQADQIDRLDLRARAATVLRLIRPDLRDAAKWLDEAGDTEAHHAAMIALESVDHCREELAEKAGAP